jgi:hypothetical protein
MLSYRKSAVTAVLLSVMPLTSVLAKDSRSLGSCPGAARAIQSGLGAKAEIVIPLSSSPALQRKAPWRLQVSAGPQLSWTSAIHGKQ